MKIPLITTAIALAVTVSAAAQIAAPPPAPTPTPVPPTLAQVGMFIYPAKGQAPEQQAADEAACTQWAESQTGLKLQSGSVDTGKGAAIGAVAGAMGGRRARRQARRHAAEQGAQQAQAQGQQALDTFKKAAGACLEGRGYSVK